MLDTRKQSTSRRCVSLVGTGGGERGEGVGLGRGLGDMYDCMYIGDMECSISRDESVLDKSWFTHF